MPPIWLPGPGWHPGNHESAGKRYSGKTRKGNKTLRTVLTQVAHAAARTKGTYLSAQYKRLAARRGTKKAIMAVAHSILTMAYHMILHQKPYHEAGAHYFDNLRPERVGRRLIKRLQNLGYEIQWPLPTAKGSA